ncbi:probable monogalactosyldiacylglycerol synthase 3, chloroplastic isoform X2 [Rutidosis leptorrhynchoides]|uniref:probable monogalactosyldiacylglycerol synthase 3, chloroplastic isoform X2 n=1 Tax=Rutidosis leptorrhynchoides TaxID=125765 RepID=UPI003A9A5C7F
MEQMVVICGRNKALASSLESLQCKIPGKVGGSETQMQKWMGVCDCIITKAGPGTIDEALIRGHKIDGLGVAFRDSFTKK